MIKYTNTFEEYNLIETIKYLLSDKLNEQEISFEDTIYSMIRNIKDQDKIVNILFSLIGGFNNTIEVDKEIKNIDSIDIDKNNPLIVEVTFTKPDGKVIIQKMKTGKLIKKLVDSIKYAKVRVKDEDIEHFVRQINAKGEYDKDDFKLVSGKDIVKYYNRKTYDRDSGQLGNSCMKYDNCSDYIQFYANHSPQQVNLLIKMALDKKDIVGRALIWKLDDGSLYMDRIYVNDEKDIDIFLKYAKEELKIKKTHEDESLRNLNETITIKDFVNDPPKTMPYMDTFNFGRYTETDLILFHYRDDRKGNNYNIRFKQTGGDYKKNL